jgi:hypothetical protein
MFQYSKLQWLQRLQGRFCSVFMSYFSNPTPNSRQVTSKKLPSKVYTWKRLQKLQSYTFYRVFPVFFMQTLRIFLCNLRAVTKSLGGMLLACRPKTRRNSVKLLLTVAGGGLKRFKDVRGTCQTLMSRGWSFLTHPKTSESGPKSLALTSVGCPKLTIFMVQLGSLCASLGMLFASGLFTQPPSTCPQEVNWTSTRPKTHRLTSA